MNTAKHPAGVRLYAQSRRARSGHRARIGPVSLLGVLAALSACSSSDDGNAAQKVNGSVHITAGSPAAPAATVNGGIDIADDAAVTAASTVNGGIHLGAHATADSLNTVNGNITVGAGARVAKGVETVNGSMTLGDAAEIQGPLGNINGKIEVTNAHIAGGIKTVNGGITLTGNSHVEGGIVVEKASGQWIHFGDDVPHIVIGPGVTVQGELRFEREVKLYVSDRATIGAVKGATAISFSGATPPKD